MPGTIRAIVAAVLAAVALAEAACSSNALSLVGPSELDTRGFTIAVIPDTQCYTSEGGNDQPAACGAPRAGVTNEMFMAQARFIAANRVASRTAAAIGVGDVVNCGSEVSEWENARRGYDILDEAGLPYAVAIGNHDYDTWCTSGLSTRPATNFNAYFGSARFAAKAWYGEHFPSSSSESFYIRFDVDGDSYVVLVLEYLPRDAALAWAAQVVEAHRYAKVIVVVHSHLDRNGAQRVSTTANDGANVWSKLLRKYANIILVLSGHDMSSRRVDFGDAGNQVPQIQSDYQFEEAGGNGYMRLLHVRPDVQQIDVTTYSPYLRRARTDLVNQFSVDYGIPPQGLDAGALFLKAR